MRASIRAITFDLDDTLWPFAPIGERIERVLHAWLLDASPATAAMYPIQAMRLLRDRVTAAHPHLVHDLGRLRRLTLETALRDSGGDPALADEGYALFYAERNRVDVYPDVPDALTRIARRVRVGAISNGNADLERIAIGRHFSLRLHASEHGAAKPDASIFLAACRALDCRPEEVLHVGDHVDADVRGAARAGLRSCWLRRDDHPGGSGEWPHADLAPDLVFATLAELADWLETDAPG